MFALLHEVLLLYFHCQVLGQVTDLDNGVYGIAVHQDKVAVAAGENLYIMTMNKTHIYTPVA